jgi:DNA-binding response OmpR family regulator
MRLLVVEDESALTRHLQRGLEEAAWTVDVCDRVEEAWRLVRLNTYDLILLDLSLPIRTAASCCAACAPPATRRWC